LMRLARWSAHEWAESQWFLDTVNAADLYC
jgi:hypothetical protein